MSELEINGIRLSFIGPQTLPLSVVRRESPKYDAPSNFFTITLNNESDSEINIPFEELSRNTVVVYRNLSADAEIVDNRVPPPKPAGTVEKLSPGETKSYQVIFSYPHSIAQYEDKSATLQFCVKWESSWLRVSKYSANAFDWNESFELCQEIKITDDTGKE